eukprot:15466954-Alexandrium_andersonii.AAC.1
MSLRIFGAAPLPRPSLRKQAPAGMPSSGSRLKTTSGHLANLGQRFAGCESQEFSRGVGSTPA